MYKELADIAAPLLLKVIHYLQDGHDPNPFFNCGHFYFCPKDASFSASRTRPICASNTDNKIVSNVVRLAITPAFEEIISDIDMCKAYWTSAINKEFFLT